MQPSRPTLQSERLLLRPVAASDTDAMQSYRGREDVVRYLTHKPLSPAGMRARNARSIELWGAYPAELFNLNFVVELLGPDADGDAIGDLRVWNLLLDGSGPASEQPSIFWIGYAFHPDMQGKGYAREAAARVIRWLFAEHAASEVRAIAFAPNTPSIALLEKLGFQVFRTLDADPDNNTPAAVHLRIDASRWAARAAEPANTPMRTESEES